MDRVGGGTHVFLGQPERPRRDVHVLELAREVPDALLKPRPIVAVEPLADLQEEECEWVGGQKIGEGLWGRRTAHMGWG